MPMSRVTVLVATFVALALLPAAGARADTLSATQKLLTREMGRAGASSGAYVIDMNSGQQLFASQPDVGRNPASVEKLYTSATALLLYGADGHLTTDVLSAAAPSHGAVAGNLVLRGAGDPTFDSGDVSRLAGRVVKAGVKRIGGGVVGDDSLFDAFRGPPSSAFRVSIDVGPLSALAYQHGVSNRRFQTSPAQSAAAALESALRRRGVRVTGTARAGSAQSGATTTLASWDSPTIASILRSMNQPSDNFYAETLIKAIGADYGDAGSTAAGAAVVKRTVARFDVAPKVADGSGLSRADVTTPRQVVQLLTGMAGTESASAFRDSLPVAGRSGTLARRMRGTSASGACQAKTGTLSDVSSLAGYCETPGGRRIAFAFLMSHVSVSGAHVLQDAMTAALARLD